MVVMGLNPHQLLVHVIRPALRPFPLQFRSTDAEKLLMMTAAHESAGFTQIYQNPSGPALGLWQMEPFTFYSLRDVEFISSRKIRYAMTAFASSPSPEPNELTGNLFLSCAFARAKYIHAPKLPDNVIEMGRFAKKYYNSALGKARATDYETAYMKYVDPLKLWG